MIETHNRAGTKSYGCCRNMKEAQRVLTWLKDAGEIPAGARTVTVCHYKTGYYKGFPRWNTAPANGIP